MNIWRSFIVGAFASLLLMTSQARAEWHEASSDHFVIYSDSNPKDLNRFAEMLEHYHQALKLVTGRDVERPSPSNRVTIYVVGSERTLRKLYGDKSANIAGFYIPRAGGSRAFVPWVRMRSGEPDFSVTVLLHEYAHHFLISSSRFPMPKWLSEGAAEFFASARTNKNTLEVGRPAYHRGAELQYARRVTVEQLMDPEKYKAIHGNNLASFYGRSWALYHYLSFSEERQGQLTNYWVAVASGMSSIDAANKVFGDLDGLERELKGYLRQRSIAGYKINKDLLPIGPITVRQMSEGMDAMLPIMIRSQRGVTEEQAQELLPEARAVAEQFPRDSGVLAALAEAEFDAGNSGLAIAAADRAIAIDPTTKHAYVQKGYALFQQAEGADDPSTAFKAAMKPFIALNKLEVDHPLPLIHLYRSYVQAGEAPSESARLALERASQVAPFDLSLAFNVGMMLASEGKIELAANVLAPIAANPHGGGQAEAAAKLIAALRAAPDGIPFGISTSTFSEDDLLEDDDVEPSEAAE